MKAVFASHSAFDPVLRVGSHHLSRELSKLDWDVAHVSTPISMAHFSRIREESVRERFRQAARGEVDSDGVLRIVPITVSPITRLSLTSGASQLRIGMARWKRRLHRPDFLIVDQPLLVGLVDLLSPKRIIYRPTDAHYNPLVRAAELKLLARADAVVATSARVLEEVTDGTETAIPSLVLENGVEYDRFKADDSSTPRTNLCYVGAVDGRFDWEAVVAIGAAVAPSTVDIFGPVTVRPPLDLPQNVRLMAPLPYDEVPARLRTYRVGLMPFNVEPGNAGRSPMKFYEYLAAGLNILATRTPALSSRDAPGVWFTDTEPGLKAVEALRAASNADGVLHAQRYGWDARARELQSFLGAVL